MRRLPGPADYRLGDGGDSRGSSLATEPASCANILRRIPGDEAPVTRANFP